MMQQVEGALSGVTNLVTEERHSGSPNEVTRGGSSVLAGHLSFTVDRQESSSANGYIGVREGEI